MKLLSLLTFFLSTSAMAGAPIPTACYIYIQGGCSGNRAPSFAWFSDNYNNSGRNAGVCMHRAREYAAYCQLKNKGEAVYAAFNIGDHTSSAQVFIPGSGPGSPDAAVINYGLDWTPIVAGLKEDVVIRK